MYTHTHKFHSAYYAGHSSETALPQIISDILTASDANQVSILTPLDMLAAFDTMEHSILLSHLEQHFGVSDLGFTWFESYLSNRFQFVSANSCSSKLSGVGYGVPQRSVLGLTLIVLYMQPLSQILSSQPLLSAQALC